jgi:hypothetical protein
MDEFEHYSQSLKKASIVKLLAASCNHREPRCWFGASQDIGPASLTDFRGGSTPDWVRLNGIPPQYASAMEVSPGILMPSQCKSWNIAAPRKKPVSFKFSSEAAQQLPLFFACDRTSLDVF